VISDRIVIETFVENSFSSFFENKLKQSSNIIPVFFSSVKNKEGKMKY
jgi:hypothetical protein